jgi:CP family cyanate transporter-like MFS transporter
VSRPREYSLRIALLWLAGIGLRLTVLAVPPVLLLIQADLQLTGTGVGVLNGLPIIVFGLGALPASLLVARIGALRTLLAGLMVGGIASALRGALLDVLVLYGATIVMSAGLAFMQTALPALVRHWLPQRISFATAVFSNGLLVGETLGVMLTPALVLPLAGGSWRLALALWGTPLVLFAILTLAFAPARSRADASRSVVRAWPNWRNKQVWQCGVLFGSVNGIYFGTNAFLPGYLSDVGRPDLISAVLTALNFGQLPASFALLAVSRSMERRAWPFVVCGTLMLFCILGIVSTASFWTVFFAGCLGFVLAAILMLCFALPALLSASGEVASMSAGMFLISYSEGLIISVLSGAAWDIGGNPSLAFLPIAISALPLLFVPTRMQFGRSRIARPLSANSDAR